MPTAKKRESGGADLGTGARKIPAGVGLVRVLEGHKRTVNCVAFHPQNGTLASGSDDGTVRIWDLRNGKLLSTLEGHKRSVSSIAFDGAGRTLASASLDGTVKLWELASSTLLRTLEGHEAWVLNVVFGPMDGTLASGSTDKTVKLWEPSSGKELRTLSGHANEIDSLAFDPRTGTLASASVDNTIKLWEVRGGKLLRSLEAHKDWVLSVAFNSQRGTIASGSRDKTVKIWDSRTGKLLHSLEGHTRDVDAIAFSGNGEFLASKGRDHTIRIWNCETWETLAIIPELTCDYWVPALAFHRTSPLLATAGSGSDSAIDRRAPLIHIWELDRDTLCRQRTEEGAAARAVHHTTAKIVLVGDHSVGKSALGHRLIHGSFKEQASTHGQQFWVFPALGKRRGDGTECEAILWDFAGQPDYRLVHALFVDNADLALVLFDAADLRDPLHGVEFWLKQLRTARSNCPTILVAAQTDRGSCALTQEELKEFCGKNGIVGPILTSAASGLGIRELIDGMKSLIPWEEKVATVTTGTFKRIKDYVLGLKEGKRDAQAIVMSAELRQRLEAIDATWHFTDAEMITAVGHLENYGYVKRLRTSKGELRILLQPERLNNLASSFVLEARRNPKGLGALEEEQLLTGYYDFPELKDLSPGEREVLLGSAALLFLEHNVCFRETNPFDKKPYLVFPELINLKKPVEDEAATEDGVAYTVSGSTENVFASLVVLLGYTHTFSRTAQWKKNARYEMGDNLACGFRQESERDGELDFVLCFSPKVGAPVRTLFQGLFESFLARRNVTVTRYEPVYCPNLPCGHLLDRSVVRQRLKEGKAFAFCNDCGTRLTLPVMEDPIQLTRDVEAEVESQRRAADQRTRFEQAAYRVRAYIAEQKIKVPECFISYAWGVTEHERWVEKRLVEDLQKSGVQIVFDRKDSQFGDSLTRFISRIPYCSSIIVVGTPLYSQKFENKIAHTGSIVAAEVDLISQRLIGTQEEKRSVKTLLLAGEKKTSLPPLMWDGIHADFRDESSYFKSIFDLILSLYQIPPSHPAVADLRDSLRGIEER